MPTIIATVTNDLSQDQRMQRICSSLAGAGYQVTLVGRELPDSLGLTEQPYAQHRICCKHHSGKRFYWEYNQKLTAYLKAQQPDIINSVDLDTLWAGYRAARRMGAKLVYDAHEYYSETPEVVHRPLVRFIWRKLASWLIPRADLCYTVGPALAIEFKRIYKREFGVVRNLPYRQTDQSVEPRAKPKILLYQGMINHGRGLDVVLEALPQLSGWQLWVAGHGDLFSHFRRSATEAGLGSRVRWLGFVPPAELPAITHQASLGLNLLVTDSPSYYYSLANKTFDYIQAGVPAVHMDFPEYRAIEEEYGGILLLKELSAEALVALLEGEPVYSHKYGLLRQQCLTAAADLCWEREEERLLKLYKQLK